MRVWSICYHTDDHRSVSNSTASKNGISVEIRSNVRVERFPNDAPNTWVKNISSALANLNGRFARVRTAHTRRCSTINRLNSAPCAGRVIIYTTEQMSDDSALTVMAEVDSKATDSSSPGVRDWGAGGSKCSPRLRTCCIV
jgi:hypothetical protein